MIDRSHPVSAMRPPGQVDNGSALFRFPPTPKCVSTAHFRYPEVPPIAGKPKTLMKTRLVVSLCVFGLSVGVLSGAVPPSIGNSFSTLTSPMLGIIPRQSHHMYWFRVDGTFQEIVSRHSNGSEVTYAPVESGTYSYAVSSQNPNMAVLTIGDRVYDLEFSTRYSASDIPPAVNGSVAYLSAGVFDFFPAAPQSGATSVSNRSWVNAERTAITGFAVEGTLNRWVLVRAAGPGLSRFGIQEVVSRPELKLFHPDGTASLHESWSAIPNLVTGLQTVFGISGAFPFETGSHDCAALVLLEPGSYTMHCGGAEGDAEILLEAYILDFAGPG